MKSALSTLVLGLLPVLPVSAVMFDSGPLDLRISGALEGGVVSTLDVVGVPGSIERLEVGLTLVGDPVGANGDLYVILSSDDPAAPYSVLLNRVGRTETLASGYGDTGMAVTFADDAPLGDIHRYRVALNGSGSVPVAGLSGRWSPSGREDDPEVVRESSPRAAPLANFLGTGPNTRWTLYLVDMLEGADTRLTGWSLDFNPVVVPEIPMMPSLAAAAMAGLAAWRWRQRR